MRFLLDENFPRTAANLLASYGHEVYDWRGTVEEGMTDEAVMVKAIELQAIVLTTDRDFFHTIPLRFREHQGIVVVALRQPNRERILSRLRWFLEEVSSTYYQNRAFQLRDTTWIVYPPMSEKRGEVGE